MDLDLTLSSHSHFPVVSPDVALGLGPRYLTYDDPLKQSGFHGNAREWKLVRGPFADIVAEVANGRHEPCSVLDIACANGHLLTSLLEWVPGDMNIRVAGFDISPGLVDVARQRLHAKIAVGVCTGLWVGDQNHWTAETLYDVVRVSPDYTPATQQRALIANLLQYAVSPGGRLVVSTYDNMGKPPVDALRVLNSWGYKRAKSKVVHDGGPHHANWVWIDKPH